MFDTQIQKVDYFRTAILQSLLIILLSITRYIFQKTSINNNIKNFLVKVIIFIVLSIEGSLIVSFFSSDISYISILIIYVIFLFTSTCVLFFFRDIQKNHFLLYIPKFQKKNNAILK